MPGPRWAAQLETVTRMPPPASTIVADGVAHQAGRGQDVDAQRLVPDLVPLRVLGLDPAGDPHHRRVVDQNVDPAAPGQRLAPEPVDLAGQAEIGADEKHAVGRQVRRRRLRPGAVGAVVRDQMAPARPRAAAVAAPMPLEAPVSRTVRPGGADLWSLDSEASATEREAAGPGIPRPPIH